MCAKEEDISKLLLECAGLAFFPAPHDSSVAWILFRLFVTFGFCFLRSFCAWSPFYFVSVQSWYPFMVVFLSDVLFLFSLKNGIISRLNNDMSKLVYKRVKKV